MSDVIKNVFVNYIICAVVGGLLEYISPDKVKKSIRICVVIILLLAVVAPLSKTDFPGFDVQQTESEKDYNVLMHTANLIEKNLWNETKNILINLSVDEYEIYITTGIDEEENTVYLEELKIEVDKAFESKISEIIESIPKEYHQVLKVGVKNE
ncbi:MAG: hypothetical protein IIX14_08530 [Clostridia bacterium]|nr:hypothetical protein [Clostridia bacterium]